MKELETFSKQSQVKYTEEFGPTEQPLPTEKQYFLVPLFWIIINNYLVENGGTVGLFLVRKACKPPSNFVFQQQ